MPYILRPWDRQPPPTTKINRNNPLGAALDYAWLPNDRNPIDVIKGYRSTGAAAAVAVTPNRGKLSWAGSTAGGSSLTISTKNSYPFVAVAYGAVLVNNGWAFLGLTGSGSTFSINTNTANQVQADLRRNFGTTGIKITSTATYTAGTPLCVIVQVFSDTDYRLYVNGAQDNATTSFGTGGTWLTSLQSLASTLSGNLFFTGFGEGTAIPDDYARFVTANPESELWKAFEPRKAYVAYPQAAASGTAAITAANLTFTAETLAGTSTAEAIPTAANLTFTAQTVAGASTAESTPTAANLTFTAQTLAGSATVEAAITAANLTFTAETLAGASTAAATPTAANLAFTAQTLTGTSTAATTPTAANLVFTAQTLTSAAAAAATMTAATLTFTTSTISSGTDTGSNCTEIYLCSSGLGTCAFTGNAMPNNIQNLSSSGAGYAS